MFRVGSGMEVAKQSLRLEKVMSRSRKPVESYSAQSIGPDMTTPK
jgi:hypothetical protein